MQNSFWKKKKTTAKSRPLGGENMWNKTLAATKEASCGVVVVMMLPLAAAARPAACRCSSASQLQEETAASFATGAGKF